MSPPAPAPARPLLALVAVAALLQAACAAPQPLGNTQCTTVILGSQFGFKNQLPPVEINAGIQNARINISKVCSGTMNGEEVSVCDDVAPVLNAPEWKEYTPVDVYRQGDWEQVKASVYVTQYCAT